MIKKLILLSLLSFTMILMSEAQTSTALKLYGNLSIRHVSHAPTRSQMATTVSTFVSPGIGLVWQKEDSYLEVSLAEWYATIQENLLGNREQFSLMTLRLEQGWKVGEAFGAFQVYLGGGVRLVYENFHFRPVSSAAFVERSNAVGGELEFIPKLEYSFNDKWLADVTFPLSFARFFVENLRVEDPTLTPIQQRQSGFDFDIGMRNIIVRIGIGRRF